MDFMSLIGLVLLVLIVFISGGLLAVTPWLMRRNECFAVTVPAGKQNDSRLVGMKLRYTKIMVALTVMCTVLALLPVVGMLLTGKALNEYLFTGLVVAAVLVVIAVAFALMLHFRRKVQVIKANEGWFASRQQVSVVIAEDDVPQPVSLAWNLLYIPIVVATLGLTLALYPSMPDVLPMHVNFSGEVSSTVKKGIGTASFPLLTMLFLAGCMVFSHWSISRSKRPTDPGSPATSAFAYGMFARAQSAFLLVSGLVLSIAIGPGILLSFAGITTLMQQAAVLVGLALLVVAGAVVMSVVYGQAGSRLHARMQGASDDAPLLFDDDEHWILGIIYFNKDDAALFLPERFGIGWTLNMARPAAWGILVGLVAVTVLFVVAALSLTGA